jgi:hypothetical protein
MPEDVIDSMDTDYVMSRETSGISEERNLRQLAN